jgi:predicted small lipoprotein YifL
MKKSNIRAIFFSILVMACALTLIGCGKKGPPEPPEGETYAYPGTYPPEE